jgi:hypothetical protein
MLQASAIRSTLTFTMDIYIAVANHTFEHIFMVLLIKLLHQFPSKIPTKIYDSFPGFPWCHQKTAEIGP